MNRTSSRISGVAMLGLAAGAGCSGGSTAVRAPATTAAGSDTSTAPATSAPETATTAAASPTTAGTNHSTTTVKGVVPTSLRPTTGGPSPSTTRPASTACQPSELSYTMTTDAPRYPSGRPVIMKVIAKNVSSRHCTITQSYSSGAFTVTSGATTVWTGPPPINGVIALPQPVDTAPGASQTVDSAQWDQRNCPNCAQRFGAAEGPQSPPGAYTAHASGGGQTLATTFTLTG